uniref:Uncharacterized protein n=1 Tax=Oryza sativa subsp. japonica TaxID=39947 RepID=Q5KQC3_ORYSJ|nr:hypothetical protein [Oryza sativa Japonica Group]
MDMRDRFISAAWMRRTGGPAAWLRATARFRSTAARDRIQPSRGTGGPAHPLRANESVPHVHTAVRVYFDNSFENTEPIDNYCGCPYILLRRCGKTSRLGCDFNGPNQRFCSAQSQQVKPVYMQLLR